ncbi:MAG TPA: hypothetical protein VHJ20_14590 [Polyangia bacterium]|nr:hypothetical protein [Polyangia bacterium]
MTSSWGALLIVAATIGGVDVAYFHVYRFRLAARAASRGETLAHVAQGLTFAALAAGALGWCGRGATLAAFAAHFASIATDVVLERRSRAAWGGVPAGEVALHVVGAATTAGAFVAFVAGTPVLATSAARLLLVGAAVGAAAIAAAELAWLARVARRDFQITSDTQGAQA